MPAAELPETFPVQGRPLQAHQAVSPWTQPGPDPGAPPGGRAEVGHDGQARLPVLNLVRDLLKLVNILKIINVISVGN